MCAFVKMHVYSMKNNANAIPEFTELVEIIATKSNLLSFYVRQTPNMTQNSHSSLHVTKNKQKKQHERYLSRHRFNSCFLIRV